MKTNLLESLDALFDDHFDWSRKKSDYELMQALLGKNPKAKRTVTRALVKIDQELTKIEQQIAALK